MGTLERYIRDALAAPVLGIRYDDPPEEVILTVIGAGRGVRR